MAVHQRDKETANMRLSQDNASAMVDALEGLSEVVSGVLEAAEGYVDLDGQQTTEAREQRAEHRDTWDGNIEDLETRATNLAEAFGYVVLGVKQAKKLGWKPATSG